MVASRRFIWLVVEITLLTNLNMGAVQDCPFDPCAQMPTLTPSDTPALEIGVYYDILWFRNTPYQTLVPIICQILTNFEGYVSAIFKPGAAVTAKEDGSPGCGDFCDNDRREACLCKLDTAYRYRCATSNIAVQDYNVCLATNGGDQLLISNGQERESLGIPACRLPALTFNGIFDPCATFATYEDLACYVCNLFDNSLDICST